MLPRVGAVPLTFREVRSNCVAPERPASVQVVDRIDAQRMLRNRHARPSRTPGIIDPEPAVVGLCGLRICIGDHDIGILESRRAIRLGGHPHAGVVRIHDVLGLRNGFGLEWAAAMRVPINGILPAPPACSRNLRRLKRQSDNFHL